MTPQVAVCCSILQCDAACGNILQSVAMLYRQLIDQYTQMTPGCSVLQYVAVSFSVMQCDTAERCNVLYRHLIW